MVLAGPVPLHRAQQEQPATVRVIHERLIRRPFAIEAIKVQPRGAEVLQLLRIALPHER